jgi:hypothetical protein
LNIIIYEASMIKLIADTSAMTLAGKRQDQASSGPGVWRVTGRHDRLSVVSCRQRSGEATFTTAPVCEAHQCP